MDTAVKWQKFVDEHASKGVRGSEELERHYVAEY